MSMDLSALSDRENEEPYEDDDTEIAPTSCGLLCGK